LVYSAVWEVLVVPEPDDIRAVAQPAGRGRLRASDADREQAIDTLKDAFVQGRLTKDEFDSRVAHALASRTHADLAALTADLPVSPPASRPKRKPVQVRPQRPENPTVKRGVRVIGVTTLLTGGVWAGALLSNTDSQALGTLVWAFTFLWVGIVILVGSVMLESRLRACSDGQLPPGDGGSDSGQRSKRALPADPIRPLRPGDYGRHYTAEASRSPALRPSLFPEPRLSPS
jgi:hypothetical protein